MFLLEFCDVEWEGFYGNSVKINEIKAGVEREGEFFELNTDVGTNLLQVCIDFEEKGDKRLVSDEQQESIQEKA